MTDKSILIETVGLRKEFTVSRGFVTAGQVTAVDDVSFQIFEGETFALVGESGCGKTTTGRLLLRLIEPTEGKIVFKGDDLTQLDENAMRDRRRNMQIIFQDPFGSLNPRMSVFDIIAEPLNIHRIGNAAERKKRVVELLQLVGLNSDHETRFPHEFSGGQRQRIGIARALALAPQFIVCDEPLSALDVSIQAQIITLMQELQQRLSLTYLFISHNLSVVRYLADRIAVMYLGKIVEIGSNKDVFGLPLHPYTQALLSAVPRIKVRDQKTRIQLRGDIPSPLNLPKGCRFHSRCPLAQARCKIEEPALREIHSGHSSACHLL